jgi:hypothetical protein
MLSFRPNLNFGLSLISVGLAGVICERSGGSHIGPGAQKSLERLSKMFDLIGETASIVRIADLMNDVMSGAIDLLQTPN